MEPAGDSAVGPAGAGLDAVAGIAGDGHDIGVGYVEHDVKGGQRHGIGAGVGCEIDDLYPADRAEVQTKVKDAEEAAKDEVWGGYRFVALADTSAANGLKVIDLGAGHASASETLCGRIIAALKAEALLNESVGAGYIDRHWPPAFKDTGAWPLTSLRQSFLNGALTRLIDPDTVLRKKIVEFVEGGAFGLASGTKDGAQYERLWYAEPIGAEEVAFEPNVFLLTKAKAEALREGAVTGPEPDPGPEPEPQPEPPPGPEPGPAPEPTFTTLHLSGAIPPELWNRFGTKVLPKLRGGQELTVTVDLRAAFGQATAQAAEAELRQILDDLGLADKVRIAKE